MTRFAIGFVLPLCVAYSPPPAIVLFDRGDHAARFAPVSDAAKQDYVDEIRAHREQRSGHAFANDWEHRDPAAPLPSPAQDGEAFVDSEEHIKASPSPDPVERLRDAVEMPVVVALQKQAWKEDASVTRVIRFLGRMGCDFAERFASWHAWCASFDVVVRLRPSDPYW